MKLFYSLIVIVNCISYAQYSDQRPDYLNPELSLEVRVDDLVSRLTLEEKVSQMVNDAVAIERLQIPEYNWWNECLHGVGRAGIATVFPQAIGLAAMWDANLLFKIADVISTEARAKHHEFERNGYRNIYKGLTFWSPNINIFRDPRWGRGQETYGEDPYLTSRLGLAFVKGLQGDDPKYFKVIATPKHYAVHSGPEPKRHSFDAVTNKRDLYDTYLPAFETCIKEAGAFSIMCAYNRYMGSACCGSDELLRKILREDWGFKGYVVSDCGAIRDIFKNHNIVETAPEAVALAVQSGTDLNCGSVYSSALIDAVNEGLINEEEIDISVKRLFTARFKLGMFDPPEMVKYSQIPFDENDSKEHRNLSLLAAQESIVLLKNENNLLPLNKDLKKIAVIGPAANSFGMLLGNYYGTPSSYVTPLHGIINKVASLSAKSGVKTEVVYQNGCDLINEERIINNLSSEILSADSKQGLKAEYFNNINLEGEPYFTRIDPIDNSNWIYGTRIPNIRGKSNYSIRWSGTLIAPATGEFNFIVSGNDGYRLFLDDKIIVEDWSVHKYNSKKNQIYLEENKTYNIVIEHFQSSGRAVFSVQWELLNVDQYNNAVELAKNSDVVIFVGGITAELEGEEMRVNYDGFNGGDRTNLDLPKTQQKLLKALSSTGQPIVLVLSSGSALSINWAKENIPAIIQLWYPGEEGGTALANVLFGDYNPAGRLPITFYKSINQLPPFEDYNMKGRTYRYFENEPLFPFGYGLSYTKFKYENFSCPTKIQAGEISKVSVEVKNIGNVAGDEVVQFYVKDLAASVPIPIHSLQGFTRIHCKPGESKVVEFDILPRQLAIINNDMKYVIEPGIFKIFIGGIQPGSIASTTEYLSKNMEVVGEPYYLK